MSQENELASNRRAYHNYEILQTFEAGMVLTGTEVKSLRDHGGSLQEGYVKIGDDAAYLINASIAPYRFGNIYNHEERRERKLLLHKKEIVRLKSSIAEKGLTLIPLSLYLKKGKIKLKIGLAKGKKQYDKRQAIKERDTDRQIRRSMSS